MSLPDTARPRRDQPYVSARTASTAARIFSLAADPAVPAPRSPEPTLRPRGQAVFNRVMAACMPGAAAEVEEVRPAGVQPPPPRQRRRR